MQHPLSRLVLAALFFALVALLLGIPGLFASNKFMLWAGGSCGVMAAVLLVIEGCVWCSVHFSRRQVFAGLGCVALATGALTVGLMQKLRDDQEPRKTARHAKPVFQRLDPEGLLAASLMQIRPGYTSETLIRMPAHATKATAGNAGGIIFRDTAGGNATATLLASADDGLVFRGSDKSGKTHEIDIPVGADGVPVEENASLVTEMGNTGKGGYLRVLVNGEEVAVKLLPESMDLDGSDWKPAARPGWSALNGIETADSSRFVTPWALSDSQVAALVANTRSTHQAFFAGDSQLFFPPNEMLPDGPAPLPYPSAPPGE